MSRGPGHQETVPLPTPFLLRPFLFFGGLLGHKLRGGAFAHGRGAVPGTFSEPRRLCLAPAGEREQFRDPTAASGHREQGWRGNRAVGRSVQLFGEVFEVVNVVSSIVRIRFGPLCKMP